MHESMTDVGMQCAGPLATDCISRDSEYEAVHRFGQLASQGHANGLNCKMKVRAVVSEGGDAMDKTRGGGLGE